MVRKWIGLLILVVFLGWGIGMYLGEQAFATPITGYCDATPIENCPDCDFDNGIPCIISPITSYSRCHADIILSNYCEENEDHNCTGNIVTIYVPNGSPKCQNIQPATCAVIKKSCK